MENTIVKLQKKYKLKKLKKIIINYNKLNLYNLSKKKSFDELCKIIQNKSVLEISQLLLKAINNVYNYNESILNQHRVFLSAYLIANYPDITLSSNRNNLEEEIYKISIKLINKAKQLNELIDTNNILQNIYLYTFKSTFNQYSILFSVWKHMDKEGIIEMLAIRYDSLKRTLNFIEKESKFDDVVKEDCIKILKNQLIGLEDKVKLMDKNFNLDHFKKYSELREKIEYNLNKAYWDKISEEMQKDNFEGVINQIKQIINSVCNLVPNRKDIHKEIKDKIDMEIIEQLIENRMFTGKTLLEYTEYLFDWIKKLSSPSRLNDLDELWSNLLKNYPDKEYHIIVPEIFNLLYKIIGLIEKDISLLDY